MSNIPSWSQYFLDMIKLIKARSIDRSNQVGCVIVGNGNSVLSLGYNGFPRGVNDTEARHDRPLKYKLIEHAERNAIYNAVRNGVCLLDSRIYVDVWPCTDCSRAIIQSGISKIIMDGRQYSNFLNIWGSRWGDDFDIAHEMLFEAGVECVIWSSVLDLNSNIKNVNHTNWRDYKDLV